MGHVITLKGERNAVILDPRREFRELVEEYMGCEAATLFDEIISEVQEEIEDRYAGGDDYEAISDGYRGQLVDVMNDIEEILCAKRINRKRLEGIYLNLNNNL